MSTINMPPSRRKAVQLNFLAQISGIAFVLIQGIFLVPLYLRYVGVPLYGAWLASSQVIGWVTILDPGTDEVMRQRAAAAHGGGRRGDLGQLIGTGLAINSAIALCITAATLLLIPLLPHWFRMTGQSAKELINAAIVLAVASGATVVAFALGSALQAIQRTGWYGIVLTIGNFIGLALTVAFLFAGWGISAIAAGLLFKAIVWIVGWTGALLWICRPNGHEPLHFGFSMQRARELIRLAGYMLVSKVASMLQTSSDGMLTGRILGPSQTAILVLTGKVIDAARLFPEQIGGAIQPSLSNLAGAGYPEKTFRISVRYLTLVSLLGAPLIATAVVMNHDVVRLWVGGTLFGGQSLTVLIAISTILSLLTAALYHVLFANGLIETTSKISLAAGIVKVALLLALLRWLGLIAVPIATIASIVVTMGPKFLRAFSSAFRLSPRQEREIFINLLSVPAICAVVAALLLNVHPTSTWLTAVLKSGVVLCAMLAAILALRPDARREAMTALQWARLRLSQAGGT